MTTSPLVVCKNIHKSYGQGANRFEVLKGINLSIDKGELRFLMGPSGSGKTTLISIIAAILTPDQGECFIENVNLLKLPDDQRTHYRGQHIGFVFQIFHLVPMLTTEENIAIPLLIQKVSRKKALEKACELLTELNMQSKIGAYPKDLSGGEQQRIAIARALVHNPKFIVCDEPTSFLDQTTGSIVMELLQKLVKQKNVSCVVVTHDARIESFADKIDRINDGQIING